MGALGWAVGIGTTFLGAYLATRSDDKAAAPGAQALPPAPGQPAQPPGPGGAGTLDQQQLDAISYNEGGVRVLRDAMRPYVLGALAQNKVTPAWVGMASSTGPLKYSLTPQPMGGNGHIFVAQSQANGWIVTVPVAVLYPHLAGERHLMLFSSPSQVTPGYLALQPWAAQAAPAQAPMQAPPPGPPAIPPPQAPWTAPPPQPTQQPPGPPPAIPPQPTQQPPGPPIYIPAPAPGVPAVIAVPIPIPVPGQVFPAPASPGQAAPGQAPAPPSSPAIPAAYQGKSAAELRAAAAQFKSSNPALASLLEGTASQVYQAQRAEAVGRGGSSFKVLQGHIPYKVAQHYTGDANRWKEIDPLNPGMNLAKQIGWSNKTVLLPLGWDIESKLPAPTAGTASKESVAAAIAQAQKAMSQRS